MMFDVFKRKGAGFNDQQAATLTETVQASYASLAVAAKLARR
jgi:hypothetical protein